MTEGRNYADFDLLIESSADQGYRARVVDSPAGQASGTFEMPFSDMQLENFMLRVGRPRRGVRRLESPEMAAARDFGSQLYDAVFKEDLQLSLRRSLDAVERNGEGLRIRLWFSDAPKLASLPWEFLFSQADDQFLVLSVWTPIVRYLDLTQPVEPLTVEGPLRILAVISSPHDYPELDVDAEWRRIEEALEELTASGAVAIDRTESASLIEVQRLLRRNDYHVFHFVGHGGFDEGADDGVLVLEDENNRSRVVAGRDLGTILSDQRTLRLAVLNACEGARAGEDDPFSGVAQSLVRKGIPGVVAMQFEITDDAAIAFAQEFYASIADGYPVDAAIGESRRAIFSLGNDIEWGTPVVYMRGDGKLFDVHAAPIPAETVVPPVDEPPSEPVAAVTEAPPSEPEPAPIEPVVEDPVVPPEPEPVVEEPVVPEPVVEQPAASEPDASVTAAPVVEPGEAPTDRQSAVPAWLLWALAGTAGLVLVFVAIFVFGGDEPTDTTIAGGEAVTTTAVVADDDTESTEAPQVQGGTAADGTAVAARTAEPKIIDGFGDDWPDPLLVHEPNHQIYVHPDVLAGTVARAGASNTAAVVLAWDPTSLYVFAEVTDDVVSARETGNQVWRNDAVNLNGTLGSDDAHQLTLSAGDPEAGTQPESAHYIAGSTVGTGFAEIAVQYTSTGYVLEARIPWAEVGVTDPHPGDEFVLLLTVFDNDGEQLDGRWLQAEILANQPRSDGSLDANFFRSPEFWGTLTLEE